MSKTNIEEIQEYSELEDNWDYDGALAIPTKVINTSLEIAKGLYKQIMVVPTCSGTILFEDRNLNNYFSLEVLEDRIEIILIKAMSSDFIYEYTFKESEAPIANVAIELLNRFYRSELNIHTLAAEIAKRMKDATPEDEAVVREYFKKHRIETIRIGEQKDE